MGRLLAVRITRWPVKLLYVVVAWLVGAAVVWLIPVGEVGRLANCVVTLAAVWYGSRVFRGRGEPVAPQRAWWRMTAWRKASGWIGVLSVLGILRFHDRLVLIDPAFPALRWYARCRRMAT